MLTEEVTEEDVAEVVSKWTGIPVSRLMEGEVEKLIHMEDRLHDRVVGQDDRALGVPADAHRRDVGEIERAILPVDHHVDVGVADLHPPSLLSRRSSRARRRAGA